jgi:ABC-type uncharacterized transport system auxiliary subunit
MLKNRHVGSPNKLTRLTVLGVMAMFLVGCSGLTKSDIPAVNTWWLEPLNARDLPAPGNSASEQPSSVLVDIAVIPGLDTSAILTLSPDAELNRFSGATWTGDLAELLQSLVSRSLNSSTQFEVVTRRNSRDLDRCILRLQVRAFYAELSVNGNAEDIRIAMSGDYDCKDGPNRRMDFDKRVSVKSDRMVAIVAAFQSGLNEITKEMILQMQQSD